MFGALQGQHGAFPPSSLWKGDAGAYVKKSSLSLTKSRGHLMQRWPDTFILTRALQSTEPK
jgi:hypothetical protein